MASMNQKALPKPQASRFVTTDEKLMTSGHLSDVEVKCGTQTWKLHRLILTSRCVWFDKALNGQFKEGKTGVVTIQEFHPYRINILITFIYTGALPVEIPKKDICLVDVIDIYELGDYFMLPELCEESFAYLEQKLCKATNLFQRQVPRVYVPTNSNIGSITCEQSSQEGEAIASSKQLYDAVKRVYAHDSLSGSKQLRAALLSFYSRADLYLLGRQSGGIESLLEIPQFAVEVLSENKGLGIGVKNVSYPKKCYNCSTDPLLGTSGYFAKIWLERHAQGYRLYGSCRPCV